MFGPEAQRQGEVALAQRYQGAHRERLGTAVQGAGALGGGARRCGVSGAERRARPLPQAGRAAFDEQDLPQVGVAPVALGPAAMADAAGGASLHALLQVEQDFFQVPRGYGGALGIAGIRSIAKILHQVDDLLLVFIRGFCQDRFRPPQQVADLGR